MFSWSVSLWRVRFSPGNATPFPFWTLSHYQIINLSIIITSDRECENWDIMLNLTYLTLQAQSLTPQPAKHVQPPPQLLYINPNSRSESNTQVANPRE
jgi:hypothetical protein